MGTNKYLGEKAVAFGQAGSTRVLRERQRGDGGGVRGREGGKAIMIGIGMRKCRKGGWTGQSFLAAVPTIQ